MAQFWLWQVKNSKFFFILCSAFVNRQQSKICVNSTDDETQQESVYVKQNPPSETLQPDGQVKLQCSLLSRNKGNTAQCLGEHQCPSVHWFRAGLSPSNSIFIYTDENSSNTDGNSCHYSLTDSLDEGTYYCAVVTCGKILFGDGTRVVQSMFSHFVFFLELFSWLKLVKLLERKEHQIKCLV